MPKAMSEDEVRAALSDLGRWSYEGDALHRELAFGGFAEALAFLVRVGIEAERTNHHPEIRSVYDKVWLTLSSHDAGGVTERDLDLARRIDAIVG